MRRLNVEVSYPSGLTCTVCLPIVPAIVCNGDGWHEGVTHKGMLGFLPSDDAETLAYLINEGPFRVGTIGNGEGIEATFRVLNPEALPEFEWSL